MSMVAAGMYGCDSDLALRDKTIHDFRESNKDTKRKIIEKMLTLRHNMKYNKHLLSVYMKAKTLFDTMIEEHRAQLHYLDEIYRHLNHLIRENISAQKTNKNNNNTMMNELIKDKKRIGSLLKKMRDSFNKLMDIDTVIGVTIAQINEITFMEDHDQIDPKDDESDDDESDSEPEDDSEAEADEDDEDDDDESDSEPEAEDEDESDSEPEAEDESDSEAEADDSDSEPEDEDEDNDNEPIDEDDESDSEPEDDSESEAEADDDSEAQKSIYLF